MEQSTQGGMKCQCQHHSMLPVFVILFGILFLLNAFGVIGEYTTAIIWPILVIAAGLSKLTSRRCRCCGSHA